MTHPISDQDPLPWLSDVLWPDGAVTVHADDGSFDDDRVELARWWASPSADAPSILVPADIGRSARVAVGRYHDGMGLRRRARSALAEAVVAAGPTAGLVLDRNLVVASVPTGPTPDGVLDGLAKIMDEPDLRFAVSLGGPKSNRKPVLQLIDPAGRCRGWAKVGWNTRSDRLIGNEAAWLVRRSVQPVSSPGLLHDVFLADRRVVVSGAAGPHRRPRRSTDRPPSPFVFQAVCAMGAVESTPIDRSSWWRSVEAVLPWADTRELRVIEAAVESAGGRRFRVGGWHGDLTPWNLMTDRDRYELIDWEFAADGVPLGFDLCHFHTQVGAEMKGLSADAAIDRSIRLSPQGFADLDLDLGLRRPLIHLYLVELIRRTLALRAEGYPLNDVHFGPAAVRRLERAFSLFPPSPTTAV